MIKSVADLVAYLHDFHSHFALPMRSQADIPADVPRGLATVYGELGGLVDVDESRALPGRPPFGAQDRLLPLSKLRRVDGMIEFAWENQGNWSARCPTGLDDPPVFSNARDSWSREPSGFVQVCGSLDHFLITLCLQEAVMSCRNLMAFDAGIEPDQVLSARLRPLWLDAQYVAEEASHWFWDVPEAGILVMMLPDSLWVGSTRAELQPYLRQAMGSTRVR